MSYGYVPQYMAEEQELSESDGPSDGQIMQQVATDVTELYRRKHQAVNHARNTPGTYYHMPGYFEQQSRLPTTCACNLQLDPRLCYYKTTSPNQEGMFRSSTHLTPNLRTCRDTKSASAAIKKYPVTARTPRYYRCTAPPLCKRPSTLCLPVTCQPDPALFHRPRKIATEVQHYRGQETAAAYAFNDYVMKTTALKKPAEARPVDSEGDVNSRLNDLENLLTKFEEDDVEEEEEEGENEPIEICGVNDLSKILKPKVPASVKAKQERVTKLRAVKPTANETIPVPPNTSKFEVKEATEEPLELLLQRLSRESGSKDKHGDSVNIGKEVPKTKPETRRQACPIEQKPPLDDNSALELHKSKSYIVSLIDKALSKELGTIPGDKCTRKEFLSMNPKKAIDMVNRHTAPKLFTGSTSLDVTPAGSMKKELSFGCRREEPMYLKQLKQLRWSHLRHIQREAKRLADLERFLDSFGEIDSPP